MISIETVEQTIMELEHRDTSFATIDKLADCYIVRDHLRGYSASPEAVLALAAQSEFMQAANGKNPEKVMRIMDDLMGAVKELHPKMYDQVLQKIQENG